MKMEIKFYAEIEGKVFPLNLDELLYVAAVSGAQNGDAYSGFTSYKFTREGVIFKHLPSFTEALLVKWDGTKVKLPLSEES